MRRLMTIYERIREIMLFWLDLGWWLIKAFKPSSDRLLANWHQQWRRWPIVKFWFRLHVAIRSFIIVFILFSMSYIYGLWRLDNFWWVPWLRWGLLCVWLVLFWFGFVSPWSVLGLPRQAAVAIKSIIAFIFGTSIIYYYYIYGPWPWDNFTGFQGSETVLTIHKLSSNALALETETEVRIAPTAKTLWDWLQILIFPLGIAGVVAYLSQVQRENELEIAKEREDRATIRDYQDRMSELILKHDLPKAETDPAIHTMAQARTLSALRSLNKPIYKSIVIQFLRDMGLAHKAYTETAETDDRGYLLQAADLRKMDLADVDLVDVNLAGANLREADLRGAFLRGAKLQGAFLEEADLQEASLRGAKLQGTFLAFADLQEASLAFADLQRADLWEANLQGAFLVRADLRRAELGEANLREANLSSVRNLETANLENIIYDSTTKWPSGFTPPPSRDGFRP